jgi:hypothetical protein
MIKEHRKIGRKPSASPGATEINVLKTLERKTATGRVTEKRS